MLDLKPCPFCGNDGSGPVEDALHVCHSEPLEHNERHTWTVQCDRCTATMGYSDSEDEAIEAWNCRVQAAARPAVTDAYRILGDQTVGVTLSAHPCTTSPVVDHETANVDGEPNAVTDCPHCFGTGYYQGKMGQDTPPCPHCQTAALNTSPEPVNETSKSEHVAAGEPVAWQGYWPGAGSINSVTRLTRFHSEMLQWKADGAEITALAPVAAPQSGASHDE